MQREPPRLCTESTYVAAPYSISNLEPEYKMLVGLLQHGLAFATRQQQHCRWLPGASNTRGSKNSLYVKAENGRLQYSSDCLEHAAQQQPTTRHSNSPPGSPQLEDPTHNKRSAGYR